MYDPNPKAFNPPEEESYTFCEWCGGEIYSDDYVHEEHIICKNCAEYAESFEAVADFIDAYPRSFISYLREMVGEGVQFAVELVKDYRDFEEGAFSTWLNSCNGGGR